MSTNNGAWSCDVPVSMPAAPHEDRPGLVDVGDGFMLGFGGLVPALDINVIEEYLTPTYAPVDPGGNRGG
jgi:hypothetical protein